jgi:hypothetical protein
LFGFLLIVYLSSCAHADDADSLKVEASDPITKAQFMELIEKHNDLVDLCKKLKNENDGLKKQLEEFISPDGILRVAGIIVNDELNPERAVAALNKEGLVLHSLREDNTIESSTALKAHMDPTHRLYKHDTGVASLVPAAYLFYNTNGNRSIGCTNNILGCEMVQDFDSGSNLVAYRVKFGSAFKSIADVPHYVAVVTATDSSAWTMNKLPNSIDVVCKKDSEFSLICFGEY